MFVTLEKADQLDNAGVVYSSHYLHLFEDVGSLRQSVTDQLRLPIEAKWATG
jgi:acyl-CoA thioesterase FadM